MVYFYGPQSTVTLYIGAYFKRTPESEGLTIGTPFVETPGPAGGAEPRALVAYPFSGEQVAYATNVVKANGHELLITISDRFPAAWRWPVAP
jgi:hypothetical protein